jgi:hypothetical protein
MAMLLGVLSWYVMTKGRSRISGALFLGVGLLVALYPGLFVINSKLFGSAFLSFLKGALVLYGPNSLIFLTATFIAVMGAASLLYGTGTSRQEMLEGQS